MNLFRTKKFWYISLFSILYLIVAFSSFWHACAFFGLANNSWMSIILAFAFEVGQAAVLFSLLTSTKDRSRIIPWVLMTMFTLVQVIGNVFSSYKYLITNSVENLRYFKEPIFIWTDLPNDEATVIITYVVGAILPISSLLLTSMITNYLTDEEDKKKEEELKLISETTSKQGPNIPIELKNKQEFIDLYNNGKEPRIDTEESKSDNDNGKQSVDNSESKENTESTITEDPKKEDSEIPTDSDTGESGQSEGSETDKSGSGNDNLEDKTQKESHFINLK